MYVLNIRIYRESSHDAEYYICNKSNKRFRYQKIKTQQLYNKHCI